MVAFFVSPASALQPLNRESPTNLHSLLTVTIIIGKYSQDTHATSSRNESQNEPESERNSGPDQSVRLPEDDRAGSHLPRCHHSVGLSHRNLSCCTFRRSQERVSPTATGRKLAKNAFAIHGGRGRNRRRLAGGITGRDRENSGIFQGIGPIVNENSSN